MMYIVIRWTGSSVTWTQPLIKCQLTRRERSENKERGPLRDRYVAVLGEARAKMQSDKKTILEPPVAVKKRLLLFVDDVTSKQVCVSVSL
jgi:hypothetical protein